MTPVISCMMIEALMYGFMPRPTTEKVDRPPPENRSSRPKSGVAVEEVRQRRVVDARDRDVRPAAGRRSGCRRRTGVAAGCPAPGRR